MPATLNDLIKARDAHWQAVCALRALGVSQDALAKPLARYNAACDAVELMEDSYLVTT